MPNTQWDAARWPNFKASEFTCQCGCGRMEMKPEFLDKLQAARTLAGVPLAVNSGFRCTARDVAVGTSGTPGKGPHTTGLAADIRVASGKRGRDILGALCAAGVKGIGVNKKGSRPMGFLHVDDLRERIWSY